MPSGTKEDASTSKPGAHAQRGSGRSRKGGKGRDRKEKSRSDASSSSNRERNARSKVQRSSGDGGSSNPGAHPTTAPSRGKSKGKSSDSNSARVGASTSTGKRVDRKGRHDDSSKHSSAGGAAARSSAGQSSSDASRVEAKLRNVGLGNDEMVAQNTITPQVKDVPNAYEIEAELVVDDEATGTSRNQGQAAVAVASQGIEDSEDQSTSDLRNRRPWGKILFVGLLVIGGALAAFFLTRGDSEAATPADEADSAMPSSSSSMPSNSPSMSLSSPPTDSLYPANSLSDCESIASGGAVTTQDLLILTSFEVRFDVSLTLQLSDLSEIVEVFEARMQRIFAPSLANCRGARRLLVSSSGRQLQIEQHVIGNAQFKLEHQPDQSCDSSAPIPCIRVLGILDLYLKGIEDTLPLANVVTGMLVEQEITLRLGLTAPFNQIEVVAITAFAPTFSPSSAPTTAPLYEINSGEVCDSIAIKGTVPNQDTLIARSFDVRLDVSLTLQLSDLSEIVEEMDTRMQRIIAPQLAECLGSRRWLHKDVERKLAGLERYVIGNAQFFLEYNPEQSCDASAPTPCIRVLAKLDLYLKGDQETLPLVNHITSVLGTENLTTALGLTAAFSQIEVVGLSDSDPTS
ncbi:MAG: hypothetical protein SGBAC_010769 [Bacillariaceae sp.]